MSEFLDGESLREVLGRAARAHREAIDYAVQIVHGQLRPVTGLR